MKNYTTPKVKIVNPGVIDVVDSCQCGAKNGAGA
ncbi:hypothetical protein P615_01755 [Brevibacillus laterosporus PE36]|nr:hypothetical protein P615_01755 [Brevibacillus laterosporus PE36]